MQNSSQDNRLTIHDIPSTMSPNRAKTCLDHPGLSTPPKTLGNSKSPLANLRLKKSKRRECTPAYSPKNKAEETSFGFWTEKANRHRLNFDEEKAEFDLGKTQGDKKGFLNLIEDSLNEVSENYFGHLGAQTTPDVIFNSVFSEKKNSNKQTANIFDLVSSLVNEFRLKNSHLLLHMKTRVVYFDANFLCYEMALGDLMANLIDFESCLGSLTLTDQVAYLPGKISLNEDRLEARLVFDLTEGCRLAVVEIYLNN